MTRRVPAAGPASPLAQPAGKGGAAGRSFSTIWRFSDGKPGHAHQSEGLIAALAARLPVRVHDVPLVSPRALWRVWWSRTYPGVPSRAMPDLLIGAGHATHLSLLAARRAHGGRIVVLMKPSLPRRWFDLCIVPRHDAVPAAANILETRGVLNHIRPRSGPKDGPCLVLIGGPSAHHDWDVAQLRAQLTAVVAADERAWRLASSRRTPQGTLEQLQGLSSERVQLVPWQDAAPGWLAQQLVNAPVVWVSEDSVSMIYEALTAGAACGLLAVPRRHSSRVSRGVDELAADGLVQTFAQWRAGARLQPPQPVFNEADRCAAWIAERWLHDV